MKILHGIWVTAMQCWYKDTFVQGFMQLDSPAKIDTCGSII